jgi:hypothetical protein
VNNAASDIPAFRLLGSMSQYFYFCCLFEETVTHMQSHGEKIGDIFMNENCVSYKGKENAQTVYTCNKTYLQQMKEKPIDGPIIVLINK